MERKKENMNIIREILFTYCFTFLTVPHPSLPKGNKKWRN